MWTVGITGSIATGKSTLLEAFAKVGVPVFSADAAVAELYAHEAVAAVDQLFPGVARDGSVDRQELGRRLADDPSGFARLEALVHPLVRQKIARFVADMAQKGHAVAAIEVPLLFESGFDYGFDAIAVTHVDDATQRQRILARPGMSVEKMESLVARQMPQAEKKKRATYLFDTSRPRAEIDHMVAELVEGIKAHGERP
ncbi:MAG: dephospho-CoA kinase [Devosia sp.]|uniref:dephospho-CoA kinase n=1 Tax=Devosia sp. TaxID=1871048 RepID=UPI0024C67427|nr:dephospho-CoA kinase [Devosia sp.]UYN98770.1 MAG: dephospho-CoA kinase [Devosia sp.]